MNKIQFWVLTALSIFIVVILGLQIVLLRMANYDQARVAQAQQIIQEGQACDVRVRQLAARIYQVAQQTQDQGLKDLLTRQQITLAPQPANQDTTVPNPAPAPIANP